MTRLAFWTKVWYGFGNTGQAVKNVVFSTFLFFYYNQVLGLSSMLCGLAVFIALAFDAVNDPLIGYWSDQMKSKRWGKRLIFMLFGGLPFAIFLFCLFIPPTQLTQTDNHTGLTARCSFLLILPLRTDKEFEKTSVMYALGLRKRQTK